MDAARQMGFVFKERLQSSVVLDMLGQEVTYEVLNVMEYSSDRWGPSGGFVRGGSGWLLQSCDCEAGGRAGGGGQKEHVCGLHLRFRTYMYSRPRILNVLNKCTGTCQLGAPSFCALQPRHSLVPPSFLQGLHERCCARSRRHHPPLLQGLRHQGADEDPSRHPRRAAGQHQRQPALLCKAGRRSRRGMLCSRRLGRQTAKQAGSHSSRTAAGCSGDEQHCWFPTRLLPEPILEASPCWLPPPPPASLAQGLRTLVVGTKIIDDATYQSWDRRYQEAAASFSGRDEALDALGREIEDGLELIGVTAIEDKLQVWACRRCKRNTRGVALWDRLMACGAADFG